jgi:hypothetical protein
MDVVGERVAGSDISKTDEGVRTGPGRGQVAAFRQEVRTFGAVTRQLQRLAGWLAASDSNNMCSDQPQRQHEVHHQLSQQQPPHLMNSRTS